MRLVQCLHHPLLASLTPIDIGQLARSHEKRAPRVMPCCRAKTFSEWQAWAIAGQQTRWRLVTLCPGVVLGPPVVPNYKSGAATRQDYTSDPEPLVTHSGWQPALPLALSRTVLLGPLCWLPMQSQCLR